MRTARKKERLRAFTLIELLVTISILGILASLLVPSIGIVRRSAALSFCANNLRQIAIAQTAYACDSEGFYTDRHDSSLPTAQERVASYWSERLCSVTGVAVNRYTTPFDCREFREKYELNAKHQIGNSGNIYQPFYLNDRQWGIYSYHLSQQNVLRPSETFMLVEGGDYNSGKGWLPWDGQSCREFYGPNRINPDIRHSNGANYAYFDGHVAYHRDQVPNPPDPSVSPWRGY